MLELVNENHPILSIAIPPIDPATDLEHLSKEMFMIMWLNGGIGLAAPQVGMSVRMFVMGPQEGPNYVCINPEIVETSEDQHIALEGCLSYPALWLNIKRPQWVQTRYTMLDGTVVEHKFEGLMARCYLHELEHLDGKVFLSKVKTLSLKLATKRQQKSLRKIKRAI